MRRILRHAQADPSGDAFVPVPDQRRDRVVRSRGNQDVEHLLRDEGIHSRPVTASRLVEQCPADVAPAVVFEGRPVGRRRVGEGEDLARGLALGGDGRFVGAGRDHGIGDQVHRARASSSARASRIEPRAHHVAQVLGRRVGRVADHAVGELAGHLAHLRTDGAHHDGGCLAVGEGGRLEERLHARERVALARVLERRVALPAVEDGAQAADVVAHARGRRAPGHPEALLDVALHLRTHADLEAAAGHLGQAPSVLREQHRTPSERDHHPGQDAQPLGVLECEQRGEDRVVDHFGNDQPIEPQPLGPLRVAGHIAERHVRIVDGGVDLHHWLAALALGATSYRRSMSVAVPTAEPQHMVMRAVLRSVRSSSWSAVTIRREPVQPTG